MLNQTQNFPEAIRLLQIPEEIQSDRLIIRAPRIGDEIKVNEAVQESFKELHPWMPWARQVPTLQETESFIVESRAKYLAREDLQLLLFLKDETFVGSSGLHRIKWEIPSFEIGYWCRTSLVGKGYVSEAVRAIAEFAFKQLNAKRVEIKADARNSKSWKIPEVLGFRHEGTLRHDCLDPEGLPRSTKIYSIISLDELKGGK